MLQRLIYSLLLASSFCTVCARPRPRHVRDAANEEGYSVVTTGAGQLKGTSEDVDSRFYLDRFLGIPYAKPPVGERRLARPEALPPWTGTRDALEHGAKCRQRIIPEDPPLVGVPFSEDCLFLDIYGPRYKAANSDLVPVMVFIHGGGFYGGTGALYNFTNVALREVIVVSVSYRLDVFGFLSTMDEVIPGNYALLDQALALDWIKSNIENFGGDPDDLTLFGGSAGAACVSLLGVSPYTRGKFQKAIQQSGSSLAPWAIYHSDLGGVAKARKIARDFGLALGCDLPEEDFSRELLTCARKVDAVTFVNVSVEYQMRQGGGMVWLPVVETTFGVLPDEPLRLMQQKGAVRTPTILGYTSEDGSTMVSDPTGDGLGLAEFRALVTAFMKSYYGDKITDGVIEECLDLYLPVDRLSLNKTQIRSAAIDFTTDFMFSAPIIEEAAKFAGNADNTKTYVFEFSHVPSYSPYAAWYGSAHADEKGFVLGLPEGPDPFKYPTADADDDIVADFIVTTWTNFAKFSDPTPQAVQSVTWPEFQASSTRAQVLKTSEILRIDTTPSIEKYDRAERVEFFTRRLPQLLSSAPRLCGGFLVWLAALLHVFIHWVRV